MLARSEFEILGIVGDAGSIPDPSDDPHLCIIGGSGAALESLCTALAARFPRAALVLVEGNATWENVQAAWNTGLGGYLPFTMSAEEIVASLRLIVAGHRCFPAVEPAGDAARPGARSGVRPGAQNGAGPGVFADIACLTSRERTIALHIRDGKANKVIARELRIAESTVKAHLGAIMRKTGAENRTQVARWALEHERPPGAPYGCGPNP